MMRIPSLETVVELECRLSETQNSWRRRVRRLKARTTAFGTLYRRKPFVGDRSMDPREHLLGLIEQLYAAPGTAEGWHPFLDRLCTILNGSAASFISHDLTSHLGDKAQDGDLYRAAR